MRQLTSLDAQFLALESARQTGHVGSLAILDPSTAPGGIISAARVQDVISERIALLPPLRWRLAEVPLGLDHPYWIDDADFDLEYHVREIALPPPGDDDQLAEQVARICARPLDRARPLWEIYVIYGLAEGHIAMLTKIHHAVIDGMSGAEILGLLLDLQPEGREVPEASENGFGERAPSELEMLARGLMALPRYPFRALRALPRAVPNIEETPFATLPGAGIIGRLAGEVQHVVLRENGGPERANLVAPKTTFNGRVSAHRRFVFGRIPLEDIKQVKNKHGCTVNDVAVSMCAGAVRRWLVAHDELPDESLVAQIPVSVRTGDQAGTFGNRILLMSAPLYTDIADPVERLQRTHEGLADMKQRHRALPGRAASGREQLHPARGLRAGGAADVPPLDEPPGPAGLEPRHLECPRPADPALHGRRAARGELPRVGHHRRDGPEHHADELLRDGRLRDRRRP